MGGAGGGNQFKFKFKENGRIKLAYVSFFCIGFFDGVVQNTQHEFLFASSDLFS
jgi:hypothetical protein